jgi:uncharacterized protein YbaP (TraB family)
MRRLLATLLPVLPAIVGAQSTPRALLWSVTAPMGEASYLYGTFHSRDARVFQFQDSVLEAFGACDIIAGELEVNEARRLDNAVMNAMLLPSGSSLDRLYNKRDYLRVIDGLKEKLGPLAPMCTKLRPFYTVAMLSEMELGNDSAVVLDAWFQQRAEAMDRKVVGLETITEQLAAVERIPLRDQARILYEVIAGEKADDEMGKAMNAYAARDLDALMRIVGRDGLPEHADKALLEERNARMVARLSEHMSGGHRVFAAIGAAHLPGEKGMIAELQARGFTVRPVAPMSVANAPRTASALEDPVRAVVLPPSIVLKKGVHVRNDTLGYSVDMPSPPVKRVIRDDDSLRVVEWTSTSSDGHHTVSVTTWEGSGIVRKDARSRIDELRMGESAVETAPAALTRVDGSQAFASIGDPVLGDQARHITVATPMRTHVFAISNDDGRSKDFVDRVVRSIRITEGKEVE